MHRRWPWLLGLIGAVVYFAVFEALAFRDPEHYASLSNTIATIGLKWPLSIYICGFFSGGLACHFFWPWQANPLGPGEG